MSICTNSKVASWFQRHPKISQWVWFGVLWLVGLMGAGLLALPVKLLIKL